MANYFLTNKAVADLSAIWDYTYETWSESQADKYYDMLVNSCKELSGHPEKGRRYKEIDAAILGRKSGRHIIFYRVIGPEQIEIVRILHEKMDLKNRMQD